MGTVCSNHPSVYILSAVCFADLFKLTSVSTSSAVHSVSLFKLTSVSTSPAVQKLFFKRFDWSKKEAILKNIIVQYTGPPI